MQQVRGHFCWRSGEGRGLDSEGLLKIKKGKLLISHRYNHLPLLHSCPGGVQ